MAELVKTIKCADYKPLLAYFNRKIAHLKYFPFFFLLMTYLYNPSFEVGINIYLSDVFVFIILVKTVLNVSNIKRISPFTKFKYFYIYLLIYYLFIIFYSFVLLHNDYHQIFGRFRNLYFYPLCLFSGLILARNKTELSNIYRVIKVFILLAIILGFISMISPIHFLVRKSREYFVIVDRGTALLCILILIHSFLLFLYSPKRKFIHLFFIIIITFAIIGTQNRSVLISSVFAMILTLFFLRRSKTMMKLKASFVIVFFTIILLISSIFIMNSPYKEKFERRYNKITSTLRGESEFSYSMAMLRMGRTIATLKQWLKHPIIGSGWGSQIREYEIYDFKGNYIRTSYGTPHNYYVTLLEQTGIIGFAFMIYFFFKIYKYAKPKRSLGKRNINDYTLFTFFIVTLIFNVANVNLYGDPTFVPVSFFLFGLTVANSQYAEE